MHKGFQLREPLTSTEKVIVLTGRNGSGKTRLLESIASNLTTVSIDDVQIERKHIRLVHHAKLEPNFGTGYNDSQHDNTITEVLQSYDHIKNDLHLDPLPDKYTNHHGSTDYGMLFRLFNSIAEKIGKPHNELSHDDIKYYFDYPAKDIFGMQELSTSANLYIKRKHRNEYNEWRCKEKGFDVRFLSKEDFIYQFGDAPWVIINRIIKDVFDGKFMFTCPDESSQSYNYQAELIDSKENKPVNIEHLSSGEKSLLWLAITLFNCQYYDKGMAYTPKILLIDEPDAFLHPRMVLKMYQVLNSINRHFNSFVIISSHSPTTIALAPSETVYLVDDNSIEGIEKDVAIAELLDGVSQISLSPNNRRQVYVESQYDADVYQRIFSKIAHISESIDPKISLSFISAGPKLPKQQIIDKAKQLLNINDGDVLEEFAKSLIGVGDCSQVIGQVEALVENEHDTVRGIIDWDLKNEDLAYVSVLAKEYAYSIENITLDPICILLLLHIDHAGHYSMPDICGHDVSWSDWLQDGILLQESVNRFIKRVLDKESNQDASLEYISAASLLTDSEYLKMNGHALERLVINKYPQLRNYCRRGKDGELKNTIVNKSMISLTNCKFIPKAYETVFNLVQKQKR